MTEMTLTPVEELYAIVSPAVPCEYVIEDKEDCEREAEWILHFADHCRPGKTHHKLFCTDHLERVRAGDEWFCHHCQQLGRAIDTLLLVERI